MSTITAVRVCRRVRGNANGRMNMRQHSCTWGIYLDTKYGYFYDLELENFREDFAFYNKHMPENAKSILDLGCGTGRLGLALARAGYCVTGIDGSYSMLRTAVKKCEAMDREIHVHFICMDMTRMAFDKYFDAIVVAHNTLSLITDMSTLKRCLSLCRQYMKKDGRFMMDVFAPDTRHRKLHQRRLLQFERLQAPDGTVVQKEISRGYDSEAYLLDVNETYRVYEKSLRTPQDTYHYKYQLLGLSREQWEDILSQAGFHTEAVYGDYALNPYIALISAKMLVVAKPV
jgi:SAM-dependent methyltransferase